MLPVSIEALTMLGTQLATHGAAWLAAVAAAPLVLGLAFYAFVPLRVDLRELGVAPGDHWITGGALAIATLAASGIVMAARATHTLAGVVPALRTLALSLWLPAIAWLPVLVATELRYERLRYDLRRWSTVFPVGMYSACSFVAGSVVPLAPDHRLRVCVGVGRIL